MSRIRHHDIKQNISKIIEADRYLEPHKKVIENRLIMRRKLDQRLTASHRSLSGFASGHLYYGLRFQENRWILREWAPNAERIYLTGDMTDWKESEEFSLSRISWKGDWELVLPAGALQHGEHYKLRIYWNGGSGERIPAYATRVVQDPETHIFSAQVWNPKAPYQWKHDTVRKQSPILIYEAHTGMAQDCEKVGSFTEFTENIIPRIVRTGYNTIQLMAVQEHPYYGSFGYHISSFFAVSSRFGTPEELKELIDTAHGHNLRVIIDLVHSHSVCNENEGLSRFDGTYFQYFHEGERGNHTLWGSRCFNYKREEVIHFLLSNCRFWLEEYRVDGFRFDGITSMLYTHHGMNKAFTYKEYYDNDTDEDALAYLYLANKLIHEVNPDAITIAEDVSGMPGLATGSHDGGTGFDYRFAMGIPDYWTKLLKDVPDEAWNMGELWHELNNRRHDEKTISYAESHDQALVGDQTHIFRMIGAEMYDRMLASDHTPVTDRGMAHHKMLRILTLSTAGGGYLNFMGNEFGHPEWIDFPREGNGWSCQYATRKWHLADNTSLKYQFLARFDRTMIELTKKFPIADGNKASLLHDCSRDKVLAFQRGPLFLVFNFHPSLSHPDYTIPFPPGKYRMILDSDAREFGGHGRLVPDQVHFTAARRKSGGNYISLYLPTRTMMVLIEENK